MPRPEGSLKEPKDNEQNKKFTASVIYKMDCWQQTDQNCRIVSFFKMHKSDGNHLISKGCKKVVTEAREQQSIKQTGNIIGLKNKTKHKNKQK